MMDLRRETLRRAVPVRRPQPSSTPARVRTLVLATLVDALVIAAAITAGLSPLVVVAVAAATVLVVALATQHSLRSALAGLTLMLVRPYGPGELLRLYLPEVRHTVDAELVRVGLVNTTLATHGGLLVVPNTLLLRHPPQCRGLAG